MAKGSKEAQERAEASFKRKEIQARDGRKAMVEYEAATQAMRDKTAKLRELRLARDAEESRAEAEKPAAPLKKKRK